MSQIENLDFKRGDLHLRIPSWEIADQGVTAVVGASGCGKSTLMRILCGLEDCQGWTWLFKNEDLTKLSVEDRRFGVVFQNYELFGHLTAFENILLAADARRIRDSEKKCDDLIDRFSLQSCRDRRADHLSGGEAQRVALARALVGEPRLLLLDEPFSALDANTKQIAREWTAQTLKNFNVPALLITHDEADLVTLAARTFKLEHGLLSLLK